MGWASGLEAGRRLGQQLIDTYDQADLQRQLGLIDKDRPQELQGYTGDHGEQLRAMAEARDPATGKPYYNVGFDDKGNYTVTPNFDDPTTGGRQALTLPRGTVTDYLGSRTEGTLSPEQQRRAKGYAYAGVLSARDPVRGLALENSIRQSERDDVRFEQEKVGFGQANQRFAWEAQRQPLELTRLQDQTAVGGLQRKNLERDEAFQVGIGEAYNAAMKDPSLLAAAIPNINGTSKQQGSLSITVGQPDKRGFVPVSVVKADGKASFFNATPHEQATLYAASQMMGTHPLKALETIRTINKDLADAVHRENEMLFKVAEAQNVAAYRKGVVEVNEREVAIKEGDAPARRDLYRAQAEYARGLGRQTGSGGAGAAQARMMEQAQELVASGRFNTIERAYSFLKRGDHKLTVDGQAETLEAELRKNGVTGKELAAQINDLYVSRGVAPPKAIAQLKRGVNPETGKKLTGADLQEWNNMFPNSPVEDYLNIKEVGPSIPGGKPERKNGLPDRIRGGSAQQPSSPSQRGANSLLGLPVPQPRSAVDELGPGVSRAYDAARGALNVDPALRQVLESKLSRGEPLTQAEAYNARRLGLVP